MPTERFRLVPSGDGEGDVGAPGVPTGEAPFRLAVADQPDLVPISHEAPKVHAVDRGTIAAFSKGVTFRRRVACRSLVLPFLGPSPTDVAIQRTSSDR